ncbi:hypothetical protein EI77_00150 [Prosthecobacter fusiformis]|uniref:Uncharacterized protein n=1 Tax=Prosthecobacter fusiformis TaxID=48464 RepID=A0A4R7SNT7_9BACT|nr:hypothetical protein [Prosthecobacter fusiformis]TDU80852.1 hypothetical protein EI77_00150 [Prosthecobacter fusiformis]
MSNAAHIHQNLKLLIKGDPVTLAGWLRQESMWKNLVPMIVGIVMGCAAYGFAIGLWRAPLQGLFVAVKMPCLIFLTLMVNGLINGMLGLLLGSGMSFRQTLMACLMSFATFSLIVGSLSPIAMAVVLDAPRPGEAGADDWYRAILLTHTAIIAFAGVVANHKLLRLIQVFSGSRSTGWRTLLAWLAGNLFVGAQLSYNFRPFFGNPALPIQFLRPNPFDGSFYESVWSLSRASLPSTLDRLDAIPFLMLFVGLFIFIAGRFYKPTGTKH